MQNDFTELLDTVSRRQAFWVGQGYAGRDVFLRLAEDPEIPSTFKEHAAAAIFGLSVFALRQRRSKGRPPAYMKLSGHLVVYTREALFHELANSCVRVAA
jgi:hypothetical protein